MKPLKPSRFRFKIEFSTKVECKNSVEIDFELLLGAKWIYQLKTDRNRPQFNIFLTVVTLNIDQLQLP